MRFQYSSVAVGSVCLLTLSALAACQRHEERAERVPVSLGSDEDWSYATHPAVPLAGAALHALAARVLIDSGRFIPAQTATDSAPLAARLSAQILSATEQPAAPGGGDASASVRLRVQYVPPLTSESAALIVVGSGSARGKPDVIWQSAVSAALSNALDQATAEVHGRTRSKEELLADLRGSDPALAEVALDRLAARRQPEAFAPLVQRLQGADPEAAQRSLAALVSLDDARAVRPIIDEAERRNLAFKIEALYALGSLGGDEAEGYLDVLTSDSDARVRGAAMEALAVARSRTPSGTHAPHARASEPVR
jgi:hypothetical protein